MARRPQNLDLSDAHVHDRLPTPYRPPFHMDLPSPRAGEIPPALSPLDAFALHSRALARKLEKSSQNGRRMSRLPHHEIADELAKRPDYFRSASSGSESYIGTIQDEEEEDEDDVYQAPRTLTPGREFRPVSHYPMLGSVIADKEVPDMPTRSKWTDRENEDRGYFGIKVPRSSSPEPFDPRNTKNEGLSPAVPSLTSSIDSIQSSQPRTLTNDSTHSRRQENSLAPPKSPGHPKSPRSIASIRSVIDSGEEDNASTHGSIDAGSSRKVRSPFSPDMLPVSRSPSALSEYSMNGDLPRPSFNFSRPRASSTAKLSVENRPSFEARRIDRKASNDSSIREGLRNTESRQTMRSNRGVPSRQNSDNGTEISGVMSDRDCFSGEESSVPQQGAPSYVYSKYSLPRGRIVDRDSAEARASMVEHQFQWEEAKKSNLIPTEESPLPSPKSERHIPPPSNSPSKKVLPSSANRSRSAEPPIGPSKLAYHKSVPSSPSITSESTDHTIRAKTHVRSSHSTDIASLSPEEHLEKGIECHTSGSLSKSTYHLRLAAKAGLPTAMLLYALACRHGWGMRPNQAEGVSWLRRAVDSAGLEFVEEDNGDATQPVSREQKGRKAQFALAIYELGMSYMNGWGIPKDKPLAVRCFEIAGSWGDTDALAEAGFCYTQGVGCKKDLKKAAQFYRQAADKGMNMAGNSWIYKPKYMDEPSTTEGASSAKSDKSSVKNRSRSRTLFGRKKAGAAA